MAGDWCVPRTTQMVIFARTEAGLARLKDQMSGSFAKAGWHAAQLGQNRTSRLLRLIVRSPSCVPTPRKCRINIVPKQPYCLLGV